MSVPLHLVQGQEGMNVLTEDEIRTLVARRPNIRVHVIEGGHLAYLSHPDEVALIASRLAEQTP